MHVSFAHHGDETRPGGVFQVHCLDGFPGRPVRRLQRHRLGQCGREVGGKLVQAFRVEGDSPEHAVAFHADEFDLLFNAGNPFAFALMDLIAGQLARQTPAVAVAEGGNDADPTELIRLREQMADLESQLQDAQALAGQFPIQAVEIRRLEHQLTEMRAERDDLKAKVTEAAVYIRDVQKRYQLVLDKMRQLLVQRERGASPESLASLKAQVESEDLDSATGIAADDTKVAVSVSQLLPKDRPVDEDDLTPPLNKSGNGVHKTPTVVSILEVEPAEAADDEADDDIPKTEFMPLPPVEPTSAKRSVDLQVIKGIGRTYAQRLREAGIHSLSELVKATPEQLREVTGIEEWHAADPASWIAQARQLLASG